MTSSWKHLGVIVQLSIFHFSIFASKTTQLDTESTLYLLHIGSLNESDVDLIYLLATLYCSCIVKKK